MKKLPILILLFMFAGLEAKAQVKIGYTNPQMILSQLPEVNDIDIEIGLLLDKKDSLLAIQAAGLQKEFDDYNASKGALSQEQRQVREQALLAKNQEFEAERQKSLNEVQQRQIALLQPIEAKVFATIKSVADSLGLDMVLNQGSVKGGAFIFYASDAQVNITEMVLEKLKQS